MADFNDIDDVEEDGLRISVFGQQSAHRAARKLTSCSIHRGTYIGSRDLSDPRDPVGPSQKVFGVGARRVQVPSEKVRLDP